MSETRLIVLNDALRFLLACAAFKLHGYVLNTKLIMQFMPNRSRGGPLTIGSVFTSAPGSWDETNAMKNYSKILFSILVAMMCTVSFAADKPASCKKSGKNCPMNDNKECNCGKACDCKAPSTPK